MPCSTRERVLYYKDTLQLMLQHGNRLHKLQNLLFLGPTIFERQFANTILVLDQVLKRRLDRARKGQHEQTRTPCSYLLSDACLDLWKPDVMSELQAKRGKRS